jgi:hypothetical protein
MQYSAAGNSSYRSSVVKALDGPAAYLWALDGDIKNSPHVEEDGL